MEWEMDEYRKQKTQCFQFQRILQHLYLFQDTCNVYVVTKGNAAVLIDFGSGAILEHLSEIGVEYVYALLHTHHHRDQCQGDFRAVERGIPIFVPFFERRHFSQAELYWATKQLWDMYNVRNTYSTLIKSIPVQGFLEDFKKWEWEDIEFFILPTPGHTLGSLSIFGVIDGKQVVFSGDLLYSPGKVPTLYDLQYNYSETDGLEATILSIENVMRRNPQLLCPSHGAPMKEASRALHMTKENLTKYYSFRNNGLLPVNEQDVTQITPHLLAAEYACSHFYAILSDDSHALLVDYGSPNFALFSPVNIHFEQGETVRFVEHSIHRMMEKYNIKKIDAVIPTHYHDDHVNGIPYLQSEFGVECWVYAKLRDILENPYGEQIGCVMPFPIRVDRTLAEGEVLKWRGYEFAVRHTPGHTEYAVSLFSRIDGKSVGFTGDNIFIKLHRTPSVIYRNHLESTAHRKAFQIFLEYKPEIICGGHEVQYNVTPEVYEKLWERAMQLTKHFEELLPDEVNYGLDPLWFQLYPYQSSAEPGDRLSLEIRIKNFYPHESSAHVSFILPQTWSCEPEKIVLHVDAHAQSTYHIQIRIPNDFKFILPRVALAADVVFNDWYLGQVAEAVVIQKSSVFPFST